MRRRSCQAMSGRKRTLRNAAGSRARRPGLPPTRPWCIRGSQRFGPRSLRCIPGTWRPFMPPIPGQRRRVCHGRRRSRRFRRCRAHCTASASMSRASRKRNRPTATPAFSANPAGARRRLRLSLPPKPKGAGGQDDHLRQGSRSQNGRASPWRPLRRSPRGEARPLDWLVALVESRSGPMRDGFRVEPDSGSAAGPVTFAARLDGSERRSDGAWRRSGRDQCHRRRLRQAPELLAGVIIQ